MRRREFIAGLGTAAAWPLAASAQRPERMRRIGVLLPAAADDAVFQTWVGAFLQGLALLGWTIGHNMRIDTRWATVNAAEIRRHAAELVTLAPDVILATGASTVAPLLQATRTVPIVLRSGRQRLRRQLGTARRQCLRFHAFRIQHLRKMA
jgi:putative tryptophan/tyrosine transport system substrate-binding protein